MKPMFDHEKLHAYQKAVAFVAWVDGILHGIPKSHAVHNQLDRASTSIPLNIAEGNGKFGCADRCRYFDTARASALECAACLDVLVAKALIAQETGQHGKAQLVPIVGMLIGLIKTVSPHRLHEEPGEYTVSPTD